MVGAGEKSILSMSRSFQDYFTARNKIHVHLLGIMCRVALSANRSWHESKGNQEKLLVILTQSMSESFALMSSYIYGQKAVVVNKSR